MMTYCSGKRWAHVGSTRVIWAWLGASIVALSASATVVPPVHNGDSNPAAEGFTEGDSLPITGEAVNASWSIRFRGLQRYKVNLSSLPSTWTMTLRGTVQLVQSQGLGVAVSLPNGKAVTVRWVDTDMVSDLTNNFVMDATQRHTYQIVYDGKAASLWVDGEQAIASLPERSSDSIGADSLDGWCIGNFKSIGGSLSSWNLWKFEDGVHIKKAAPRPSDNKVRDIGSRLELFVDDWLIDFMTDSVSLKLHSPRPEEVVLHYDKPWEGRWSGYVRVLWAGDRYRMYYRAGLEEPPRINDPESVAYAESTDGITWTKPELDLYDFEGYKRTNIVWRGVGSHCGFGVFEDKNPNCKPDERYKVLSSNGYKKPVYAFASPDAVRWHLIQKEPVIDEYSGAAAAYDSHFCTWWDPASNRYMTYHRIWYRPIEGKVRSVALRSSEDFLDWTQLRRLNFGDTAIEHIYTNGIAPYARAPHMLLGFPRRFWPSRKRYDDDNVAPGLSDTCFMSSRDGIDFDRRFMQSFVRPDRSRLGWITRSNTVASGMLQTAPHEISLYVSHGWSDPDQHIRRYVVRTDGFVSAHATYAQGSLTTKPILFAGKQLLINYATSAAGSIRVEIQDDLGNPVPGFTVADCPKIYGDEIAQVVGWNDGSSVASLAGKAVRLRFVMKDADLYSFQFK